MPASFDSILRSMSVSVLRIDTAAPGTTAPDGSETVPVIVPEPAVCAKAAPASRTTVNMLSAVFLMIDSLRIRLLLGLEEEASDPLWFVKNKRKRYKNVNETLIYL